MVCVSTGARPADVRAMRKEVGRRVNPAVQLPATGVSSFTRLAVNRRANPLSPATPSTVLLFTATGVNRRVNPCGGFVPLREDLPTPETDAALRRLLAPDIALYEAVRDEFAERLRAAGINAEGGKARGRG